MRVESEVGFRSTPPPRLNPTSLIAHLGQELRHLSLQPKFLQHQFDSNHWTILHTRASTCDIIC